MAQNRKKTYLAGPIGIIPTAECKEWRDYITDKLKIFGIQSLNPLGRFGGDRLGKTRDDMKEWNNNGDLEAIRKNSSEVIIPPDLKMVEDCDFVTCWVPIDDGYEICGTYGECTLAFYLKKPVYIVTNRCLEPNTLPQWLIGCSTTTFKSWEDYLDYVRKNYGSNGT